jgi:hypothetical protein
MDQLVREIELMDRLTPQLRTILNHVKRVGYITPVEAWDHYRIRSLSRRMCDFKDLGFDVTTERRAHPVTGQTYTRYYVNTVDQKVAA